MSGDRYVASARKPLSDKGVVVGAAEKLDKNNSLFLSFPRVRGSLHLCRV